MLRKNFKSDTEQNTAAIPLKTYIVFSSGYCKIKNLRDSQKAGWKETELNPHGQEAFWQKNGHDEVFP